MDRAQLEDLIEEVEATLALRRRKPRQLDITRGKPAGEQLDLSNGLENAIGGDFRASDGSDTRNYGGLRGIPEARALGEELMDVPAANILCSGNSSLSLMRLVLEAACGQGLWQDERHWRRTAEPKVLAPVPGYDRHFTLSESFGLGLVTVPMTDTGPDMAEARRLAAEDASIKGIWCVPKYSNPTGCVYDDATVAALAELPRAAAADDFVVLYDNAYAVHDLVTPPRRLAAIAPLAEAAGTADHVVQFASTSKITWASGGLGFLAASETVLSSLEKLLGQSSIGPDKVNQLRHARFLGGRLAEHMAAHAALIKPKFDVVLKVLDRELGGLDVARWTRPEGGYFVSCDVLPGLAADVCTLAETVGLKLTPAGATFPYGRDPDDSNLRIAPTFASLDELESAMELFTLCVKLAAAEQRLGELGKL